MPIKKRDSEVMIRLEKLAKRIERDRAVMKKMREEWYREYIQDTGIKELFIQYGEKGYTREDITHEQFDESSIRYQIDYIKHDLNELNQIRKSIIAEKG
jgi:hypothetical protein